MPFFVCNAQTRDLWNAVSSGLDEMRRESAARVDSIIKGNVKNVELKASLAKKGLQAKAFKHVKQIEKKLREDVQEVQASADEKVQDIACEAKRDLSVTKRDFNSHLDDINQNIATQIIYLIRDAEETAFKVECDKREKIILDKLQKTLENSRVSGINFEDLNGALFRIPVPDYWKMQVAREFYTNSEILEQVVIDAEMADQVDDFMNCFKQQKEWFDKTLSSTKYTSDPAYIQIINKKNSISNMVFSVKKSESYLLKWRNFLNLTKSELNKIKLLFLYEINFEIQRLNKLPVEPKQFTDNQIKQLTLKITQNVTGRAAAVFPRVNFKRLMQVSMVPRDMRVISKISEDVSDLESEISKKHLNINILRDYLKKLNSDLSDLSAQIAINRLERMSMASKIEKLRTDVYNKDEKVKVFRNELLDKNIELENLAKEMTQTKKLLTELKVKNDEAKNKIEIVEIIAIRTMNEQGEVLKNKIVNSDKQRILEEQENLNKQDLEVELAKKTMFK